MIVAALYASFHIRIFSLSAAGGKAGRRRSLAYIPDFARIIARGDVFINMHHVAFPRTPIRRGFKMLNKKQTHGFLPITPSATDCERR